MQTEYHRWFSPNLGRDMELKVYGHWGKPLLVFPCSCGRFFDYEGMGMIREIAGFIDAGKIKLFAVDSVDGESWYNFDVSPYERNQRHEAYDGYIVDEVIPFIRDHCRDSAIRPITNGCSMGALHAVNFMLKHPDQFDGCIALSGLYRLDRPEFGLSAQDLPAVYFNSPLSYLPGLADLRYLDQYRRLSITVCVGQGAWEEEAIEDTRGLADLFYAKNVPARMEFWGYDVNHDWPWWYRQMDVFLADL